MSRSILGCLLVVVFGPQDVAACDCFGPRNAAEANGASVIFQGRVTRVVLRSAPALWLGLEDEYLNQAEVEFDVSRIWRGVVTRTTVVFTGLGGGDCGVEFQVGRNYVVPAHANDGILSTGICSGVEALWNDPPSLPISEGWAPPLDVRPPDRQPSVIGVYTIIAGLVTTCLGAFLFPGRHRQPSDWRHSRGST